MISKTLVRQHVTVPSLRCLVTSLLEITSREKRSHWSWEFLTEVVGLDADRLYPSVYLEDDEAFDIWNKEIGIPADRIFRFGKEDNFWEHGAGPCGPCSEIYYDRGEKYGCGKPGCTVGCDCDRYMEVWNNVFTQFENDGNGNYTDLETEEHRYRYGS